MRPTCINLRERFGRQYKVKYEPAYDAEYGRLDDQTVAAMVILRQQGKHTGGKPPWGYKVVGPRSNPEKGVKGNRRLEPDWEERALMLEIVRLRDM